MLKGVTESIILLADYLSSQTARFNSIFLACLTAWIGKDALGFRIRKVFIGVYWTRFCSIRSKLS